GVGGDAAVIKTAESMVQGRQSIDPQRYPSELFDLYSVPAFDRGAPDIVLGSEIGSAKQTVQTNDVLLPKIVPHIRRAWVVGEHRGRRQIASAEWIVFRSDRASPKYLRQFLVGCRRCCSATRSCRSRSSRRCGSPTSSICASTSRLPSARCPI